MVIMAMAERQKAPENRAGLREREALGWRLRDARKAAGLTLEEAAQHLGVVRQAISTWEKGNTFPTVDRLQRAAQLYGISIDWLMGNEKAIGESPSIYYPGESPPTEEEMRLAVEFIRMTRRLRRQRDAPSKQSKE